MALSEAKIRNAKSSAKIRKLSDGGGLQLWVTPAGGKHWKLAYRHGRPAKQRVLPLGAYSAVGLADARRASIDARVLLAKGVDPIERRNAVKANKAAADVWTFDAVATELVAKKIREGKTERTAKKLRWLFELARPFIGDRPVASITAPEVLAALQSVESKGRLETATRMREAIGAVFRFAVATGRAENDPTFALRGALATPKVKHRAAITNPKVFGALLRLVDGFEGQPTTKACLQLQALLFPRPGELRLAEWNEFDFDRAVWSIPAKRTKMRRDHGCPLPRQAIVILKALNPITGRGTLVFPGLRSASRAISENTMNAALRHMGISQDEHTAHGFRATASTILNESGRFSADAIERALGHQDGNEIRRAYSRGAYWAERVAMAQWWADHLDELRLKVTALSET
jgi:integrase